MKVRLKEGKGFEFVNNSLNILNENKEKLGVFDFLRYRNINDGGKEYIVERELYYRGEKFYLVRTNYDMFVDDTHCKAITLISEHDVEIVEDIKVGDKVKITDVGKLYSAYWKFFVENQLSFSLLGRYQYDRGDIDTKEKYVVEYISYHNTNMNKICVISEDYEDGKVFLIGMDGVKLG